MGSEVTRTAEWADFVIGEVRFPFCLETLKVSNSLVLHSDVPAYGMVTFIWSLPDR